MDAPRSHLVASVLLLLLIFTMSQYPRAVEARPLTLQQGKQKIYNNNNNNNNNKMHF
jgi:hypothetical protein